MFTNGREIWVQSQVVIPKTLKMVLDTSLLSTQQYKVCIEGKVEQSKERSSIFPRHLGVVAIEKGAFRSPSTTVANLLLTNIYIWLVYTFSIRIITVYTHVMNNLKANFSPPRTRGLSLLVYIPYTDTYPYWCVHFGCYYRHISAIVPCKSIKGC